MSSSISSSSSGSPQVSALQPPNSDVQTDGVTRRETRPATRESVQDRPPPPPAGSQRGQTVDISV